MTRIYSVLTVLLLGAVCVLAQPGRRMGGPGPGPGRGPGDFEFMRGEFGFPGKVVTGSPYSAQVVTQFTQTLADGTHIQRSSTSSVARDSQGRTRTERSMSGIGPMAASGSQARTAVFINDSVASMSYVLDPTSKTVRQMQVANRGVRSGASRPQAATDAPQARRMAANTEDLGTQVIQGVSAQGKRVTRTIATGQAGNDRAIQVVTETWYSPDLQMVVMSKTSDPRFGESTYQLTNVSRGEPDPSLFQVPTGYTVQQGRPRPTRGAPAAPPAQN